MKHIIVTGHSKGLGAGIVNSLILKDHYIHGISRTDNPEFKKLIDAAGGKYSFYKGDLSHTDTIGMIMQQVFENVFADSSPTGVYLVNNAGVINPIGPVQSLDPAEMDTHLRINLLAPMLLTREFLAYTANLKCTKRILNISSGAANSPYHGWSVYCTGKAALDMFTRCVATEQSDIQNSVEVMSVAPGIIDTEMQTTIRATPDGQFIHKQRFVELKETGQLVHPNKAGQKLTELLFSDEFKNGEIIDIRHLY